MSKYEVPVQKPHPSGSWRAVRSMAVPATVKSLHATESLTTGASGIREIQKVQKIDRQSGLPTTPRSPGYFEEADPSLSKS